ncbi:MAG: nicotinate-nucleotide--dimethylbenzimidazole phosphoribosyltransferase [Rhizobiaceae bacterium]|nr:nicotinate-nucleotide--dimethylbenzimidazole phosphoribosyltransferase [Rhizobiaceae bacterium]
MSGSGLPFDDVRALVKSLPEHDEEALLQAKARNLGIRQASGSMGQLEMVCEWLAAWSGHSPAINRPLVAIFAGSHSEAVQSGLRAVADEVSNISAGGGAINQICAGNDLGLKVFDLALQIPVGDITSAAALEERDCAATIAFGMEAIAGGTDLLCLGAVEVDNSISASAVFSALYGEKAKSCIFAEPNELNDLQSSKLATIDAALTHHRGHLEDPLEILRLLGGREMAALCGAILAARVQHIPVILDGYTALMAAALLKALSGDAIDHCIIGQGAEGEAMNGLVGKLELPHLLGLGVSAGNACGAALAAGVVKSAAQIHSGTEITV